MNRINKCLQALQAEGKKALVTYIVNGDPKPGVTLATMHALVAQGADILELGVPFSDPMADGPVIQAGHERALAHNTSLRDTLAVVQAFRETNHNTPVVLMGYANPVVRMGYETLADRAVAAGVDGFLTVDLPPEEATEFNALLRARELENIFLLAPTTTDDRMGSVAALAGGFLYYVSLKGVTGAGHLDIASVTDKIAAIRRHSTLPLCVGFGIKDADSAKAVGTVADGVVVGSLLVAKMGEFADHSASEIAEQTAALIAPLRTALDSL
ncbi:tryptophan synthase subunit alpha [Simiduia sp. 21SJ11W-1]|uniref:tryptophan synthase subunit alpha n=1 Tax=Simiduia sp. 21SJ11W-1 TaxID=2909669 RepID=UPI0020A0BDAA|nr:tryptophan synthase subunit alpha [Simiduia sp. 21SJ11W-1]UTA49283.1 tryptophan synthase subunit alpha [Simiduia sp. 21SJ11W-1]